MEIAPRQSGIAHWHWTTCAAQAAKHGRAEAHVGKAMRPNSGASVGLTLDGKSPRPKGQCIEHCKWLRIQGTQCGTRRQACSAWHCVCSCACGLWDGIRPHIISMVEEVKRRPGLPHFATIIFLMGGTALAKALHASVWVQNRIRLGLAQARARAVPLTNDHQQHGHDSQTS